MIWVGGITLTTEGDVVSPTQQESENPAEEVESDGLRSAAGKAGAGKFSPSPLAPAKAISRTGTVLTFIVKSDGSTESNNKESTVNDTNSSSNSPVKVDTINRRPWTSLYGRRGRDYTIRREYLDGRADTIVTEEVYPRF